MARRTTAMVVTDALLLSSNLVEDSTYAAWDSGTTYSNGDVVHVASTHKRYISTADSNLNNTPVGDDGTWWVEYGSTNKWACLTTDGAFATVAADSSGIQYEIESDADYDTLAVMGVKALTVRVVVKNLSAVTVFDETQATVRTVDGLQWFVSNAVFENIGADSGFTVEVTVGDTGLVATSELSQLVLGKTVTVGQTVIGDSSTGFQDFSVRDQDQFGKMTITPRGFARICMFDIAHPTTQNRWVKDRLVEYRNTPCLYWVSASNINQGMFVFGYPQEPELELAVERSRTTVEVLGLAYNTASPVANVAGGGGAASATEAELLAFIVATMSTDWAKAASTERIEWDQEVVSSGWSWTPGTGTFTVPAGVELVVVNTAIRDSANIADDSNVAIYKNDAQVVVHAVDDQWSPGAEIYASIAVTAGDTIEIYGLSNLGTTTIAPGEDASYVSIMGYSLP